MHIVSDRTVLRGVADAMVGADGVDSYVPHDPADGLPRPEWVSTVVESAEVLRAAAAAIFVENRGPFSGGRAGLAAAPNVDTLRAALVGYTLEVLGVGAAIQNMWLTAHAHGLGAAFMGDVVIAEDHVKQHLPVRGDLLGVLALGNLP